MKPRVSAPTVQAFIVAGLLLRSAAAFGAGFALKEQGAIDQGTSYAGATARAEDPTTLFYNPAGITRLDGYQISFSGSYIAPNATPYSENASYSALLGGRAVSGTRDGNTIGSAVLPSVFASGAVTRDLHVGLAITSPFGLTSQDQTTSLARYHALTTALRTIDIAPTIAYRLLPTLSVSGTLIVETADARVSNALDFGGIGALSGLARLGLLPGTADGFSSLKASGTGVGFQLAALFQPLPGTRVGLSFRSPITHTLTGTVAYGAVPPALAGAFTTQSASAKLTTPGDLALGVAQDVGRWTLLGDVQWTQWSRFQNLTTVLASGTTATIPEGWHDSWTVAAGADYRLTDALTLRGGAAYDETPTASGERTPRLPDSSRIWLSGGLTWRVTQALAVSGAYSHLFGGDTTVSLTDGGPGTANFLRGNLSARYHTSVDIVSLEATVAF